MSEYFPKPKSFWGKVKVKLDLSNYATKADLKIVTGVDTSKFAKKFDLATIIFIIFWDFLMFSQICFHHKWNDAWLLLINMLYMSCLTSCQNDFKLRILEN